MNATLINQYIENIAEFMGVIISDDPSFPEEICGGGNRYGRDQLEYNADWELLMPVVEKIESLNDNGFDFSILSHGSIITCERKTVGSELGAGITAVDATAANYSFDSKIDHVFRACGIFVTEHEIDGGVVRDFV